MQFNIEIKAKYSGLCEFYCSIEITTNLVD